MDGRIVITRACWVDTRRWEVGDVVYSHVEGEHLVALGFAVEETDPPAVVETSVELEQAAAGEAPDTTTRRPRAAVPKE